MLQHRIEHLFQIKEQVWSLCLLKAETKENNVI